jgi:formylglycine-generating enzyme required for sulfatase activity
MLIIQPENGSLTFASDSTVATYRPDPDFSGTDDFQYTIRYPGRVDTVRSIVRVNAVSDAPEATDDRVQTSAGEPITIDLLRNDRSINSDSLQLTYVDSASKGEVSVSADSTQITYTPTGAFTGTETIKYSVVGARGRTDAATVTVRVKAPAPTPADLDIEWRRIPEGSFVMGSDRGSADARPPHRVEITSPFRMSAHEVTVQQFRLFVEATGYQTDAERLGGAWRASNRDSLRTPNLTWRNPGFEQTDDHPVVNVSWNDAQAFAEWVGGRLPTEAEWEYAARAGVKSPKLPGEWQETTWYAENANGGTHPVGQKAPNEWGLHDVQGNVWEWVQDWYSPGYYQKSPKQSPRGPESGQLRVCRGGSWHNDTCWLPTRNRASPTYRANNIGFRVVVPVNEFPPS